MKSTTYQIIEPPPEYTSLTAQDQADLMTEAMRLSALPMLRISHLKRSTFAQFFASVMNSQSLTGARQVLHHSFTTAVPVCNQCGAAVKWADRQYLDYCSLACVHKSVDVRIKNAATCLERYGATSPAKSAKVQEKMRETSRTRYGADTFLQTPQGAAQRDATNIARYGSKCSLTHKAVKAKAEKTILDRYGVDHYSKTTEFADKSRQTCMDRYGVDNPFKAESVKEAISQTLNERYGVDHPSHMPSHAAKVGASWVDKLDRNPSYLKELQAKRRTTSLSKYGVDHPKQRHYSPEAIRFLSDDAYFTGLVTSRSMFELAEEFGISSWPIYDRMKKLGLKPVHAPTRSDFEIQVYEFVRENYSGEIIQNTRSLISPLEIDLYLPEINLAIECNGEYWHSERNGKDSGYHVGKTDRCSEVGVNLLHIWHRSWTNRRPIVESAIIGLLGGSRIVDAASLLLCDIDPVAAGEFLTRCHIDGPGPSTVNIGLTDGDGGLMALASYIHSDGTWHMTRYATELGVTVTGAMSSIHGEFVRRFLPTEIYCLVDRMTPVPLDIARLPFTMVAALPPECLVTNDYLTFTHGDADVGLDEESDRIWNCGSYCYHWSAADHINIPCE